MFLTLILPRRDVPAMTPTMRSVQTTDVSGARELPPRLITLMHALAEVLQPRLGFGALAFDAQRQLRRAAIYIYRRLAHADVDRYARGQASMKLFALLKGHIPAETLAELSPVLVAVALDAYEGAVIGDQQPLTGEAVRS